MNEINVQLLKEYVQKLIDDKNVDGLIVALKHEHPYVSAPAARALGEMRCKEAIEPLIHVLEDSWDEATRGNAIDSLGDLGDPRAIPAIRIRAITDDLDNRIRAITALLKLGDNKYSMFLTPELIEFRKYDWNYGNLVKMMQNEGVTPQPKYQVEAIIPDTQNASPLVNNLISSENKKRETAISQVLAMANYEALEAVENAIYRLTNKKDLQFYKPGGERSGYRQEVYNLILYFAHSGMLFDDPVLIQSLIPKVAQKNQQLMQELAEIDQSVLAIYQLLGIQMQLKMQMS